MSLQNFSALLLNLDRDIARLDHMKQQLAKAQIEFTRLPGILGDDVPGDLRAYFFDAYGHAKTTMKRGEIGCYASHLRALKLIASREMGEAVLVMEDDLAIDSDLTSIIMAARGLAPDWDIIRLSNPSRRAYWPISHIKRNLFLVQYSKIPSSAGAYLITPRGAEKFLQFGVRGLTFDDDLRRPWFHFMNTYGVVDPPIRAGVMNQSSIDREEPGRFDKSISSRMERMRRGDHFYVFKRMMYNIRSLGAINWLFCSIINIVDMIVNFLLGRSIIHQAARLFTKR